MQENPDELKRLEDELQIAEQSATAENNSSVIRALEELSKTYRKHNRLLDAANVEARARLLSNQSSDTGITQQKESSNVASRRWGWRDLEFFVLTTLGGLFVWLIWLVVIISLRSAPELRWLALGISVCFYFAPTIIVIAPRIIGRTLRNKWKLVALVAAINVLVGGSIIGWILLFVCAIIDVRNLRLPLGGFSDGTDDAKR